MKVPCEKCADRRADCHVECEKYIMWSKKRDEAKERDYNLRIADRYARERDNAIKSARLRAKARGRKR